MTTSPAYLRMVGFWKATRSQRTLPPHKDPALEIVLVSRGEVSWVFDDHTRIARGGDVTWTWPWERHAGGQGISTSEIHWLQIRLAGKNRVRPSRAPSFHAGLGFSDEENRALVAALRAVPQGKVHARGALRTLIPGIVRRDGVVTGLHPIWLRNQVRQVLVELAERCLESRPAPQEPPTLERVRHFAARLSQACGEPWTLEAMAEACSLGRTQFARHFAELKGETPMKHLNRLRIEAARIQLAETPASITEIAFACGFGSSQHFARVFRQYTGLAPGEFRLHTARCR